MKDQDFIGIRESDKNRRQSNPKMVAPKMSFKRLFYRLMTSTVGLALSAQTSLATKTL